MFNEDDLLPISALQHLAFCERQWGLMYLENIWSENILTAEGGKLHEKTDSAQTEVRGNLRIARSLRIHSLKYGLTGITDVVEFHLITNNESNKKIYSTPLGTSLQNVNGLWQPIPIEYKHGKPKTDYCDEVQLCGQAFCLEEMLKIYIPKGIIYYGQPKKRFDVPLNNKLRSETEQLIKRLHKLNKLGETPPPIYKKYCWSCSIFSSCLPKTVSQKKSAKKYLSNIISEIDNNDELE